MNYGKMKLFVRSILDAAGMEDVKIYPGPEMPDIPDRFVVLTPYGGPGLDLDGVLDQRSWQARCVGRQMNYESAEEIADAVDIAFISHFSSHVEGVWVPQIQRVGGAPASLMVDDADRNHFVCSYIVDVEIAIPN